MHFLDNLDLNADYAGKSESDFLLMMWKQRETDRDELLQKVIDLLQVVQDIMEGSSMSYI